MASRRGPVMVIVTGLPGTGKTTIAADLAERIAFPVFRKDEFKEILFDELGWSDADWSEALDGACYQLLWRSAESELRAGRSFILESNFEPAPHAARIRLLCQQYRATAIELHCRTNRHVLADRFKERVERGDRHPGHAEHSDEVLHQEALPKLLHEPDPWLGITLRRLEIETTDPATLDVEAIAAWVQHEITATRADNADAATG